MEEIITKNNLDTYTAGLKNKLNSLGAAINLGSGLQEDIEYIKTALGTILSNYVKKSDLVDVLPLEAVAVDLGLPSGKLWADRNVGAKSPTDIGLYFQYGHVVGHNINEYWVYMTALQLSYTSGDVCYDGARYNMKGTWRTPTLSEFQELIDNCTWTWTTVDGVYGYTVSGNGNSIFLPTAGCIATNNNTSTAINDINVTGYYLTCNYESSKYYMLYMNKSTKTITYVANNSTYFYAGRSIRAIMDALSQS